MNLVFFKKWFDSLDKQSEEYQNVFEIVDKSYWSFDDPDDHQSSAKILNMLATRGEFEMVVLTAKIAQAVFEMTELKHKASSLTVGLGEVEYQVDIYTDKDAFASMKKLLTNTVLAKQSVSPTDNNEKRGSSDDL